MSLGHFPLAKVEQLRIPPRALKHIHVKEACAIATTFSDDRIERIIGTRNQGAPQAQLYGWGPNVAKHFDATGWVYFAPLMMGRSYVNAGHIRLELEPFTVYRLNDHAIHWTEDTAPVICLFAGVFKEPDDGGALGMMLAGVGALARGLVGAPRVSRAFRVPIRDEVYANTPNGTRLVSRGLARARHWVIATCAMCKEFAIKVDAHFPYHWDRNRCAAHIKQAAA